MDQIKKAIKEVGPQKEKIAQLNLSGIKIPKLTPEMKKTLEQCKSLEILIMSDCGLQSLENLPKLSIQGLDLSNNSLKDAEIKHLTTSYPTLTQLLLTQNKIQSLDTLKVLANCKNLVELDLTGNPVFQKNDYRKIAFSTIQSINCLDGKDADGNEIEDEGDFEDDQEADEDEQYGDAQDDDDQQQEQQSQPKSKKKRK